MGCKRHHSRFLTKAATSLRIVLELIAERLDRNLAPGTHIASAIDPRQPSGAKRLIEKDLVAATNHDPVRSGRHCFGIRHVGRSIVDERMVAWLRNRWRTGVT